MTKNAILSLIILISLSLCFFCGCSSKTSSNLGTLDVSSSPLGAEVYLDNQYKGTTPVVITDVTPGNHIVELRLRGYEIWSTSGTIEEGGSAQVQASLIPLSTTPPTETSESLTLTPLQTSVPTPASGTTDKLTVLSYSSYISSIGTFHVVGEVENTGNINMQFVKIVATFYDSSKTVVGTAFTYADIEVLKPNQKSPFNIMEMSNVEEIQSVKLDLTYMPTTNEPYAGLTILSRSSYTSTIGTFHVVGEVKNSGNRDVNFVKVIGTFYDSAGKVVDTSFTYTNPSDITSGQTAPFYLMVMSPQVSKIKTYELQVQE